MTTVRDIGFEPGSVLPDYGSRCLSGVPGTLSRLMGTRADGPALPGDVFEGVDTAGIEKVVLFVFDGLGYSEWKRQQDSGFFGLVSRKGRVTPITSVFPSTTSTALTTLATGLTPQEHGLIEWYLYVRELDMTIQTLPFSPMGSPGDDLLRPDNDPRMLFEGEPIYGRMVADGVPVHTFLNRRIARTGYSSVVHQGTDLIPYRGGSDLVASLRRTIEGSSGPALYYVYWSMVDTVEHSYGPNTEEARLEAGAISHLILDGLAGRMDPSTAKGLLFLTTADHGQIWSPTESAIMLDDYDTLTEYLATSEGGRKILPWGGTRDLYLQVRDGSIDECRAFLEETLAGRARVFRTSEVVESGLFGTGTPAERFGPRVGDLMVLPSGTQSAWYRHPEADLSGMKGVHGGLHADEMTIPFGVLRGSALTG